jgi:hypothetical protein
MKYIVEVHAPVLENPQTLARKLVEQFNVRLEVASDLMKLIPGTVTKPVSAKEASTISTMLSGIGLRVSTRQAHAEPAPASLTKGVADTASRYGTFLAVSLLPALLALAATLGIILLKVQPTLTRQLLEGARNPAIAFASVSERVIGSNSITSWAALNELDAALEDGRKSFQEQHIAFLMITDARGSQLAGWYGDDLSLTTVPDSLRAMIEVESQRVTGQLASLITPQTSRSDKIKANKVEPSFLQMGGSPQKEQIIESNAQRFAVIAEAIEVNGKPIGAVVVGVNTQFAENSFRSVFINSLAVGAGAVLLASLLSAILFRTLSRAGRGNAGNMSPSL